jgi:anti-anti-sigma factor
MTEKVAACPLTLEVVRTGATAVVKCNGKLVAGVNDILHTRVSALFPDHKRVILDLTELVRVDSMGLGTLVRLKVSSRSTGCSFELINLGKQVRQLLGVTNLMGIFAVIGENNIRMG